jgi:hypothetical protein
VIEGGLDRHLVHPGRQDALPEFFAHESEA